nr:hypothetical protein [uncultured Cohaesibacter sp.]
MLGEIVADCGVILGNNDEFEEIAVVVKKLFRITAPVPKSELISDICPLECFNIDWILKNPFSADLVRLGSFAQVKPPCSVIADKNSQIHILISIFVEMIKALPQQQTADAPARIGWIAM